VREIEYGPHPAGSARNLEHVFQRAKLAHATHHLDPERDGPILSLQALPQLAQLLAHRADRDLAVPSEQEARMENDQLRTAGLRNSC
jgi:hypothetical protein